MFKEGRVRILQDKNTPRSPHVQYTFNNNLILSASLIHFTVVVDVFKAIFAEAKTVQAFAGKFLVGVETKVIVHGNFNKAQLRKSTHRQTKKHTHTLRDCRSTVLLQHCYIFTYIYICTYIYIYT